MTQIHRQQFSFWLSRMSSETPRSEGVPPSIGSPALIRGQDALAPKESAWGEGNLPSIGAKRRALAYRPLNGSAVA